MAPTLFPGSGVRMASWVAEMKARDAPAMEEFNRQIQEGVRLKALKATEELLAEHQDLLQKHQQKVAIRKMTAEATLAYWKKQDELSLKKKREMEEALLHWKDQEMISAMKQKQALAVLESLDNPSLTREISRLEKKLKSLGVEIPRSREAVAVEALGAKTPPPPPPLFGAQPLFQPSLCQIRKRQNSRRQNTPSPLLAQPSLYPNPS